MIFRLKRAGIPSYNGVIPRNLVHREAICISKNSREQAAMNEVLARSRKKPAVEGDLNGLPDSVKAAASFWAELPDRLENKKYFGRWVAYTVQGCLHVAKEHEDDQAVHRFCRGRGLRPEQYFVGRVVPDQGTAQITDNWNAG
jgi:hypothetical protein